MGLRLIIWAILLINFTTLFSLESFDSKTDGRLDITGKLSTLVSPTKYIVYVSENGDYNSSTNKTWQLPSFRVSQDEKECGFEKTPTQKIYVKRYDESTNTALKLEATDLVEFTIQSDPYITRTWAPFGPNSNYTGVFMPITQLLSGENFNKLPSEFTSDNYGTIKTVLNGTTYVFRTPKLVRFYSIENGICQVEASKYEAFSNSDTLKDKEKLTQIENFFGAGIPVSSSFAILVTIKSK